MNKQDHRPVPLASCFLRTDYRVTGHGVIRIKISELGTWTAPVPPDQEYNLPRVGSPHWLLGRVHASRRRPVQLKLSPQSVIQTTGVKDRRID